jgi:hypothetical protein
VLHLRAARVNGNHDLAIDRGLPGLGWAGLAVIMQRLLCVVGGELPAGLELGCAVAAVYVFQISDALRRLGVKYVVLPPSGLSP